MFQKSQTGKITEVNYSLYVAVTLINQFLSCSGTKLTL